MAKPLFRTEADLCAAWAETIPDGWTLYNETAGWDMLVVHASGFQVGIEAKLRLNAKVISQALPARYNPDETGPDCRAVLVPGRPNEMGTICDRLAITVISVLPRERNVIYGGADRSERWRAIPALPKPERESVGWLQDPYWHDRAPMQRLALPEYIPDVPAGTPSPMILGDWKIKAMKLCQYVERHHYVTRAHFKALAISPTRWTQDSTWLARTETRGVWTAGSGFPADTWRRMHPTVWDQIAADFETWSAKLPGPVMAIQEPML